MADKRLDSLNEYEQLKRKNRRRLVGASAMVAAAGIVFGLTVNSGEEEKNPPAAVVQTENLPAQRPSENPVREARSSTDNAISDEEAADIYPIASEIADIIPPETPEPAQRKKEAKPVYELKEGQETVEQTDEDGSVRTIVRKAEPRTTREPSLPAVTINNTDKQAQERARRKAAEKQAQEKRLAAEKAREEAQRKADEARIKEVERLAEEKRADEAERRAAAREKRLREIREEGERLEKQRAEAQTAREKRSAERKQAEAQKQALAEKHAEERRKLKEQQQREAEEKRAAELKKQQEIKKQQAEERKAAEEKRAAELKKRQEIRKQQAEERKAAEEKRAAELKKQQEAKKQQAEERKAAEEKRAAELKKQQEAKKQQAAEKRAVPNRKHRKPHDCRLWQKSTPPSANSLKNAKKPSCAKPQKKNVRTN
ncbi:hypothetical protein [Kingella potus]|uniref:hypothetical protein n=1 Tax=Kingella potus TaxID=265175 RepID=UPI001FD39CA8|nr:hypothetical protein [Kingella potus]UOP01255.1 hypothetical protein LVJ84_03040 [Kingella potus]